MVHIGRAIDPLIGARQRAFTMALVKTVGGNGIVLQREGQVLKAWFSPVPVVHGLLEGARR
jgi:hypothetical protein